MIRDEVGVAIGRLLFSPDLLMLSPSYLTSSLPLEILHPHY